MGPCAPAEERGGLSLNEQPEDLYNLVMGLAHESEVYQRQTLDMEENMEKTQEQVLS